MKPRILQNDFKRQWQAMRTDVIAAVERVGASGWYILGEEVAAFEAALAQLWGRDHAVGTGNGMDALEIGLRCLGAGPGAKVLTTPFSAFASTLAIMRAGAQPVFVDVDELGGIDFQQCREALTRDRSIRFLLPVHLYGLPLDLEELRRLRDEFDLRIVEDCAQSIGASHRRVKTGTVGQIAATSFYPTKNLGALGDGGALLTDDAGLAEQARRLRNYGQAQQYVHAEVGLNSRLDELHAAILNDALLPRLPSWTEARRRTAQHYLTDIRHPRIRLPHPAADAEPVWHLFPIFTAPELRDSFRAHLEAAGVLTSIHYPTAIPDQPALRDACGHEVAFEPVNARKLAVSETSLPIHPFLDAGEVEQVIEACNSWQP